MDTKNKYLFSSSDILPVPVAFYDMFGNITYLNSAFTCLFGWQFADLSDQKTNFIPENNKKETKECIQKILQGEKIPLLQVQRCTKKGAILDIQIRLSAFKDKEENIIGCAAIFTDITENKKLKEQLIESRELYRSVMEATVDPIVVYDTKGRVMYFNPAFSRVFKWELAERIHKKQDDFVPKENWPETREMIKKVTEGHFFSDIESARYDKNKNIIPVSISGSTFKDNQNRVIGSVINLRDIRRQKQSRKAALQQEKLEGVIEMAGAVCHELSQPAMIIEGYADLFLMNITPEDPLYDKIVKLKDQVKRIGRLTDKLMKITRYETREYAQGKIIVDIDRASQKSDPT